MFYNVQESKKFSIFLHFPLDRTGKSWYNAVPFPLSGGKANRTTDQEICEFRIASEAYPPEKPSREEGLFFAPFFRQSGCKMLLENRISHENP